VAAASYDTIIFCDDDNRLLPGYLQAAYNSMEQYPEAGAIGGTCIATAAIPFPEWWNEYAHAYATGKQGHASGDITDQQYLWGAGLVTRKKILEKVFDTAHPSLLADRKGNELSSGGDSEICARIILLGWRLRFEETLQLEHFMTTERLQPAYRDKLLQGHEAAKPVLEKYRQIIIESRIKGWRKIKRLAGFFLSFSILFSGKHREDLSVAFNVMLGLPMKFHDRQSERIIRFLQFAKEWNR